MFKFELKILILLFGIFLCMGLLQTRTFADDSVTIVLRAPTSEKPQLIKISKDSKGNLKYEPLQGLTVDLTEKTTVLFRVDEVNTVLYNVSIAAAENASNVGNVAPLLQQVTDILDSLRKIVKGLQQLSSVRVGFQGNETCDILSAQKALEVLEYDLQAAMQLNRELDELLYKSEISKSRDFKSIKSGAAKAAKRTFRLTNGTSEEFYAKAEETMEAAYKACNTVETVSASLPKDLCNPASEKGKKVLNVFNQTAKKLRMIEAANWRENDTQERVLQGEIKYTCVISPAMELPEQYPKFRCREYVVTINGIPKLSGPTVTFGSFLTHLHDDTYVNVDDKIEFGVQDRFSEGLGVLTHIPFFSHNFTRFRCAAALSGGLGLDNLSNDAKKFSLAQLPTMLGVSFLFAAPKSENLFALTAGGTIKPVKRLNGYSINRKFPAGGEVTRRVRTFGLFFAVTISYDIRKVLKR